MEAERRGKYAGVKLHLNAGESQAFIDWYKNYKKGNTEYPFLVDQCKQIAKAIKTLVDDDPSVLKDRTEEQIAEALAKDKAKIEKQQAAIASKKDWKQVK